MSRPELLYIHEMEGAISRILEIVGNHSTETFRQDQLRLDALLWNFTVLGEAAAKLRPSLEAIYPEIPWRRPIGLRNRIVHGYWSIDLEILMATARKDLLPLKNQLNKIVSDLSD
ncbi:DUF86 domain-containing protein [Arachnia propionica]|nr:HepT-like ribonuclease domain-containing protein [Arachnia propionica]